MNTSMTATLDDLCRHSEIRIALRRIVQFEEDREHRYKTDPTLYDGMNHTPYWEYLNVKVPKHLVDQLLYACHIDKFGKKYFILRNRTAVKKVLAKFPVDLDRCLVRGYEAPAQPDVIMILVPKRRRKEVLAKITASFPSLKVVEGQRCFTVTEADT